MLSSFLHETDVLSGKSTSETLENKGFQKANFQLT